MPPFRVLRRHLFLISRYAVIFYRIGLGVAVRIQWGALTVCAVVLGGCAASDFKKPIEDFSTATTNAAKSFTGYADTLEKLSDEINLTSVSSDPGVWVDEEGCRAGDSKCVLVLVDGTTRTPLNVKLLTNNRLLMTAIGNYAAGLGAIAASDDATAIKTSSDALTASIIALAKAADTLNAQGLQNDREPSLASLAGSFATPAGDIVQIGLTKYAEHRKLQVLRDSTAAMQEIFPQAMDIFAQVARRESGIARSVLFIKLVAARRAYAKAIGARTKTLKEQTAKPPKEEKEAAEYKKQLEAQEKSVRDAVTDYQAAAVAYNSALTTKPDTLFVKLGETHAALVDALQHPEPDFRTVFGHIGEVLNAATKLAADVQAIDKALNPPPKK